MLETAALEDIATTAALFAECRKLGVSFALDDFGTGSSLTYFRRLPADLLKIDQSFVRDMLDNPDDLAIVEGVIGLTQAFRRAVIAEGGNPSNTAWSCSCSAVTWPGLRHRPPHAAGRSAGMDQEFPAGRAMEPAAAFNWSRDDLPC